MKGDKTMDLPSKRPLTFTFKKVRQLKLDIAGGISCTPAGNIAICQLNHSRVGVFTPEGQGVLDLDTPTGMESWDVECTQTNIFVTDRNRKVLVFDAQDGSLITIVNLTRNYMITDTAGLSVVNNTVFLTGGVSNGLYKMERFRNNRFSRPKNVEIDVKLKCPLYLCIKGKSTVVSSSHHHCVHLLDAMGKLKYTYGKPGKSGIETESLNTPYGVALDSNNRLFIADWKNHRVCVVCEKGSYLGQIDLAKDGLTYPLGVTIDAQGRLLVSCHNPGYLLTYDYNIQ